jgi:hypothetical protein
MNVFSGDRLRFYTFKTLLFTAFVFRESNWLAWADIYRLLRTDRSRALLLDTFIARWTANWLKIYVLTE